MGFKKQAGAHNITKPATELALFITHPILNNTSAYFHQNQQYPQHMD